MRQAIRSLLPVPAGNAAFLSALPIFPVSVSTHKILPLLLPPSDTDNKNSHHLCCAAVIPSAKSFTRTFVFPEHFSTRIYTCFLMVSPGETCISSSVSLCSVSIRMCTPPLIVICLLFTPEAYPSIRITAAVIPHKIRQKRCSFLSVIIECSLSFLDSSA